MECRDGRYCLRLNDYAEVETVLASLRQAGIRVEDMALAQADLEDVFLRIMGQQV